MRGVQPAFINETATMCGDDRLADGKAEGPCFYLRSEERLEDSAGIGNTDSSLSASTMASSFERRGRTKSVRLELPDALTESFAFSDSDPKPAISICVRFSIHGTILSVRNASARFENRDFCLEGAMFLCQPLLEVLAERGIEDIDAFLKVPSWNDLLDPFSIPSMEKATARVLRGVREGERITIFGDYDCDGILGAHILKSALTGLVLTPRTYLPHREEGYGLSSSIVHQFSCGGTDLLVTIDNGINARAAVHLAQRLGIDVVLIDHHRIQERAETAAVWSDAFCGAGLAAIFAWALALKAGPERYEG